MIWATQGYEDVVRKSFLVFLIVAVFLVF